MFSSIILIVILSRLYTASTVTIKHERSEITPDETTYNLPLFTEEVALSGQNTTFTQEYGVSNITDRVAYHRLLSSDLVSVSTIAGSGTASSNDGIGTNANFYYPLGISWSSDESFLLIGDLTTKLLRKIVMSTLQVSTVAGNSEPEPSDGYGTHANFMTIWHMTMYKNDSAVLLCDGNYLRNIDLSSAYVSTLLSSTSIYKSVAVFSNESLALVLDITNHKIVSYDLVTFIYGNFAGSGSPSSVDGTGTTASFSSPSGIAIAPDESFALVAETYGNIRKIVLSTRVVTTLAGSGGATSITNGIGTNAKFIAPQDISFSPDNSFALVLDEGAHLIRFISLAARAVMSLVGSGSGGMQDGTGASVKMNNAYGISRVSSDGDSAIFCDLGNNRIRKITGLKAFAATILTPLPSHLPTAQPTGLPSSEPSSLPSEQPTGIPSSDPSGMPSGRPTGSPSTQPTCQPTGLPSSEPSTLPTGQPTGIPSSDPSGIPSDQPTGLPSSEPSSLPTGQPSGLPSTKPSSLPTGHPTGLPTSEPSSLPTGQPTGIPSSDPSGIPSGQPAGLPSSEPSSLPTGHPTGLPSSEPSTLPTGQPTGIPSLDPSGIPSGQPTGLPSSEPSSLPTGQPTGLPSREPSSLPTGHPTGLPTSEPSSLPTGQPTGIPSSDPSGIPSGQPTGLPSSEPSSLPTCHPTGLPSSEPSTLPTGQPTGIPSLDPSGIPSGQPTGLPSSEPSSLPTGQPTGLPSTKPSSLPTGHPTGLPTSEPSTLPTGQPTGIPSSDPSGIPSGQPTGLPSSEPSSLPTCQPTGLPSSEPSTLPTGQPTGIPSLDPSGIPSGQPTGLPSSEPSSLPTGQPTGLPSTKPSSLPTGHPTGLPTSEPSTLPTGQPTGIPSSDPSGIPSGQPTGLPSSEPSSLPTCQPTGLPSSEPSTLPTGQPTGIPSLDPSGIPSGQPTGLPSSEPSSLPTGQPTGLPSTKPSSLPTGHPTGLPTSEPSTLPTGQPTGIPSSDPSGIPSGQPTGLPSSEPSSLPTCQPTGLPSSEPSTLPTGQPTGIPSLDPSGIPSGQPTGLPSSEPSSLPTGQPTGLPSREPSSPPTGQPSGFPTGKPTGNPTGFPSSKPSGQPTMQPTGLPTSDPTGSPSCQPSSQPTGQPTSAPTCMPSGIPSVLPTSVPSRQPTGQPTSYPTGTPSGLPSSSPSCKPTSRPTCRPTRRPTSHPTVRPTQAPVPTITRYPTSSPTYTTRPSCVPTNSPTLSVVTMWENDISEFIKEFIGTSDLQSSYLEVVKDLIVNGERVHGGCAEWSVFVGNTLHTALISYMPTMLAFAASLTPTSPIVKNAIYCSDDGIPVRLMSHLDTLSSNDIDSDVYYSYRCGMSNWTVGRCAGATSVFLCVNCTQPCTVEEPETYEFSCRDSSRDSVLRLLTIGFNDVSVAPAITAIEVSSSRSSALTLSYSVSEATGSIVCAAYIPLLEAPETVDSLLFRGSVRDVKSITGSYELSNLQPATLYELHCATYSGLGVPMSYSSMLNTKLSASTSCCRSVSIMLQQQSFSDTMDSPRAVLVSLKSLPSESINISVISVNSAGTDTNILLPSALIFSPNSKFKSAYISYLRSPPGVYTVQASLSGPSSHLYKVSFSGSNILKVVNSTAEPPVPSIISASFSDDGTAVIVAFDTPTNRATYSNAFTCSAVFITSSFIMNNCLWESDSVVRIYTSGDIGARIGDILHFRGGVIQAKCLDSTSTSLSMCSSWKYSSAENVTIGGPVNPVPPVVSILAPSIIGPCDSLTLDLSGSSGSGGRAFKSVALIASTTAPTVVPLQMYLDSIVEFKSLVVISQDVLIPGYVYSISVELCSFLNVCSTGSHKVVVSTASNFPIVSIYKPKMVYTNRFSPLRITGGAFTSTCDGEKNKANLFFSWSITASNEVPLSLTSSSTDRTVFQLPAYSLEVGRVYYVTLTVKHLISLKSSSSTVSVSVLQGSVVARISGPSERGLQEDRSISVDASSSYDEDSNEGIYYLQFDFTCTQVYPTIATSCYLDMHHVSAASVELSVPTNSSLLGTVHEVTVSVEHIYDKRASLASIQVEILPSLAPIMSLEAVGSTRINPSKKLKLVAQVEATSTTNIVWSVSDPSVDMNVVALSDIARTFSVRPRSVGKKHVFGFSLVISPNALSEDSTFVFSLRGTTETGHIANAKILISTNSPPHPGDYTVSPSNGTKLETEFLCQALLWEDIDIPITYEFSYISATGEYLVQRARQELTYMLAKFPAGLQRNNFEILTQLQVFDKLDARRIVIVPVVVFEGVEVTPVRAQEYFSSAIINASGFADELKQAAALTSSIINAVNCTTAPNCTQLHRQQCSVYKSTCGKCLEGYLGENGHKNSICVKGVDESNMTSRRLAGWDQLSSVDTECSLNEHCNVDLWEVCVHGVCRVASQECTNECSGHGACSFISTLNGSFVLETCTVLDFNCKAVCVCESGYEGSSCEYTGYDFGLLQSIRHDIAVVVRNISLTEDATSESVVSWLKVLSAIAADSNSLKAETRMLVAAMTIEFIYTAADLGLQFEEITSTASILDIVLSTSNYAAFDLLQLFGEYIATDMAEGQHPIVLINQAFRLVSVSLDGQSNSSVLSPLSPIEKAVNASAHVAHIQRNRIDESLKVVAVERPYLSNGSYVSVPFGLNFDKSPCTDLPDSACHINIILQYEFPVSIDEEIYDPITVEFQCRDGLVEEHNYTCPLGDLLSASCNGSVAGAWKKTCPVYQPRAVCESIGTSATVCDLVQYTSTNVTCQCSLPHYSNQRKLLESGADDSKNNGEISLNFVAVVESLTVEFVSTWKSAAGLSASDSKSNWRVLVTVGSIGAVGVFFMLLGWWTDTTFAEELKILDECREKDVKVVENSIRKRLYRQNVSWERVLRPQKNVGPIKPQSIKSMSARNRTKSFVVPPEEKTVETALPTVLKPLPLWKKYVIEAKMYHRWAGVILHTSSTFPRPLRVLSLMMNILVMLFIEALTYNIADPNDGSCEKYDSEEQCLSEMSSLADHESKCYWDRNNSSCHFREIDGELYRIVAVAVIAAVVGTPCALAIEALISNILAARTIDNSEIKNVTSNFARTKSSTNTKVLDEDVSVAKKSVHLLKIVEEALGCSVNEDYQCLRNELQNHRQSLSPKERIEFDKLWGLDLTDSETGAPYNCWRFMMRRVLPHSDIGDSESLLIAELQRVRDCFAKECEFFDDATKSDDEKNSRLLYLFMKDLMDGQILDAKDRRDHEKRKEVTLIAKVYAWTAIGAMGSGILFYLFLFAIRQTEQRQAAWLQSFIVWLFFEILIVSSFLVLIQHIAIPSLVMEDVRKVKRRVVNDIVSFKVNAKSRAYSVLAQRKSSEHRKVSTASVTRLNAAKYLYVSWRIANVYPNLLQSAMVTRFSTLWPKKAMKRKSKGVSKVYSKKFAFVGQAVSRVALYLLVSVVQLPTTAQDIIVQVILSSGIGYIIVLLVRLYEIYPMLVLVPIVMVIIVMHFLLSTSKHSDLSSLNSKSHVVTQQNDSTDKKSRISRVRSVFPSENVSTLENLTESCEIGPLESGDYSSTVLRDMRISLLDALPEASPDKVISPLSETCPSSSSNRECKYDTGEDADDENRLDDRFGDKNELRMSTRTGSIHSQTDDLEDLQAILDAHFGYFIHDKTEAKGYFVDNQDHSVVEKGGSNDGDSSMDEVFHILADTFSHDLFLLSPRSHISQISVHDDSSSFYQSCPSSEPYLKNMDGCVIPSRADVNLLSQGAYHSSYDSHSNKDTFGSFTGTGDTKSPELVAIEEAQRYVLELESKYALLEEKFRQEVTTKISATEAKGFVNSVLSSTVPEIAKSQALREIRDSLSVGLTNGIIAIAAAQVAAYEGSMRRTKEEREQAESEELIRTICENFSVSSVDTWIHHGRTKCILRAICAERSERFVMAVIAKEVLKLSGLDEPFKGSVLSGSDSESVSDVSGWKSRYEALNGTIAMEYQQAQRIIKQLRCRCLALEKQYYQSRSITPHISEDSEVSLRRDISNYFFCTDDFSLCGKPVEQSFSGSGKVSRAASTREQGEVFVDEWKMSNIRKSDSGRYQA